MSSRKIKQTVEEKVVKAKRVSKKASAKKEEEMQLVIESVQDEVELLKEKDIHIGVDELYPEISKLETDLLKLNIKKSLSGLKNE